MKYIRMLLILVSAVLTGCASTTPMLVSSDQELPKVEADKAQIVFLRSSFFGSLISASLYDVTKEEPEFIGVIENGTKIAHATTPGKHIFMVVSEAADFMEAELLPGKTYYGVVTPRVGAWKARFSLWPIRNDGTTEFNTGTKDFEEWMSSTKLVVNSDESRAWNRDNLSSVKSKQAEYWPVWQKKSADDLAQRTLRAQDGR